MAVTGIIFDIKKYAVHDGPGIRTTVFFKGCPLSCWWCHNPESRSPLPESHVVKSPAGPEKDIAAPREAKIGRKVTVQKIVTEVLKDEIFYDQSGGGVTFSGGEPMLQPDFLLELLISCKDHGLHTAVDTSGHAEFSAFDRVRKYIDLFLFDIKVMDDAEHQKYTGVSNREILANLKQLASDGEQIIVRVPLIPEISDSRANLEAVVEFLKPLKSIRQINLLPYNKLGEDKVRRWDLDCARHRWSVQADEEVARKQQWLEAQGYEVKIGG